MVCFVWYRGYQQRVIFRVKQAEMLELEKKQKLVEDFAKMVARQIDSLKPFPKKDSGMLSYNKTYICSNSST